MTPKALPAARRQGFPGAGRKAGNTREKSMPTEVTIEYRIPIYIVVRRDEEIYGDNDLHIDKVVVDDEAKLQDGKGFTSDGQPLPTNDLEVVAAIELIEGAKSPHPPA